MTRVYYTISRNASIKINNVPYTLRERMLVSHAGTYSSAWPAGHLMVRCEDPVFGPTEFAVAETVLALVTACDGCSQPLATIGAICRKCNAHVYCNEKCLQAARATHTPTTGCVSPVAQLVASMCVDKIVAVANQFNAQPPCDCGPCHVTILQTPPSGTTASADCATRARGAPATLATPLARAQRPPTKTTVPARQTSRPAPCAAATVSQCRA